MQERTSWRRLIGHEGTFLASLELWPAERTGRSRHLQSGYRAGWSLPEAGADPAIHEGPVDLVGVRSLAPGTAGTVLIHPMWPEAWQGIDAGARLALVARTRHPRIIGEATVLERRGVPASAPLRVEPFEETPAHARLRAVEEQPAPRGHTPPAVAVGGVALPLLSSTWGGARVTTGPSSPDEEAALAASLPRLVLDRSRPVAVTVAGGEVPVMAEIAYFAELGPSGIPTGERRDVLWDSRELTHQVDRARASWRVGVPPPGSARAVVVTLTFGPGSPGQSFDVASWGFRLD
ncbi:hypothetical protein [Georgenia thermotolerans]|uniref:Uncharacterized protein n=1 Tax=Georgenia thermotolerans TaxID=527326 RepID=A0A7J5ULZ6_9MICO|nr:hypothetical protein [Georgenia thermotolerans]KAE8762943.1 hypothetical protein GB883_16720 [Georgenia thermotolerans]